MKKIMLLLLVLTSMFYAKGYKNSKCVTPKKWTQTTEDCSYFNTYNDNKYYCVYYETLYSGSNGNVGDAISNAMKTKNQFL